MVTVETEIDARLDNRGILRYCCHVEDVLPVVLLGQVDVIEEEGEVFEEPLGQVHVYRGPHEEAHVEDRLSYTAPTLHQPAVLSVLLRILLSRVVSNHLVQQLGVLELEVEGGVTQGENLRELLAGRSVPVPETRHVDTVDPFTLQTIKLFSVSIY